MAHPLHASTVASVADLKKDPMKTVAAGEGLAVAIFDHNAPAFYCVPAKTYEEMLDRLEDLDLNALADAREGQRVPKVTLDEL
jgi:antitoxin StbD